MRYPAYPEYGELEPDWLGRLPEHWSFRRLRFLAIEPLMYGANEVAVLEDRELPRYIRITDVSIDGTLHDDTFRSLEEEVAAPFLLKDGDILLARSGATVGKSFQYLESWGKAAYAGYLIRCRPDQRIIFPRFANYYFQTSCYWACVYSNLIQSTIENFSAEKYKELKLPLPPLPEQRHVAAFLDWKTGQIDALIAKKQALIEKLKEKRLAVITQAVTKGLDASVLLRDSHIPWLGEVPKHWHVIPIKFSLLNSITDGPHETPELLNDGVPFISAEAVKNDKLDFERKRGYISREDHEKYAKKYRPLRGDIYMVKSGATTGNVARVETDEEFNIWSPLAALRPEPTWVTTDFIFYFMKSKPFFYSVELAWSYGTQQNIGMGVIANLKMACPPVEEQILITKHIEIQTKSIDAMQIKCTEAIVRLTEYRTALITAATTGQIDVRKVKIPAHA